MSSRSRQRDPQWQVDKHIPVALIVTLFLQTAGAVWWAAQMTARVSELEKFNASTSSQSDRLVKIETRFEGFAEKLTEIRLSIDRLARDRMQTASSKR